MPAARYIATVCLAVLVSSCTVESVARLDVPERLGKQGMVIAEFHGVGFDLAYMDVTLNRRAGGYVRDNYYAKTLPPGEYTLNSLYRSTPSGSGAFGGVSVTLSDTLSLPVDRHFTIRAGEITNLGELLFMRDPRTPDSKQFLIRAVDNSADVRVFLQSHFPKLLASLQPTSITLEPADYSRGADLEKLRNYIASTRAMQLRTARYVTGPAGTLAAVDHDRSGAPTRVHLIETGFAAGIIDSAEEPRRDRFAFLTSDGRLFVLNGGRVVQRALPEEMQHWAGLMSVGDLHLAGERNIVLVEHSFKLFISTDDGLTWKTETPSPDKTGDYSVTGFGANSSGYFIFQGYPAHLYYSQIGEPNLQPVALPPPMREIRRITALEDVVVLEGFTGLLAKVPAPFFVRPRDGGDWEQRLMPPLQGCQQMQFLDQKGQKLRTVCGAAAYASADGGAHWELQTRS